MIKNKSKKNNKGDETDFSELDKAVSELSKQTAAILGGSSAPDEKKPVLPKRRTPQGSSARSFDIVTTSSRRTSMPAHLKTVQKDSQVSIAGDLKSEQGPAGRVESNLNISQESEEPKLNTELIDSVGSPEIILHRKGKLNLASDQELEESNSKPQAEEEPKEDLAKETKQISDEETTKTEASETADIDSSDMSNASAQSDKPISFASDGGTAQAEMTDTKLAEVASESEDASEPQLDPSAESSHEIKADIEMMEKVDDLNELGVVPLTESEDSGELFANNLVHKTEPKRYQPHESQHKPTVFDTNEYHPELHDWSKLEKRSSWKILVLIMLLALAGLVAYWIFSNQPLPF